MGDMGVLEECDLCGGQGVLVRVPEGTTVQGGGGGLLKKKAKLFNDDKLWSYIYHKSMREGQQAAGGGGQIGDGETRLTFTVVVGEKWGEGEEKEGGFQLCGKCAEEVETLERYHHSVENLKKAMEEKVDKIERIVQQNNRKGAACLMMKRLTEWKAPQFQRSFSGAAVGSQNIGETLSFLQTMCKTPEVKRMNGQIGNGCINGGGAVVPMKKEPQTPTLPPPPPIIRMGQQPIITNGGGGGVPNGLPSAFPPNSFICIPKSEPLIPNGRLISTSTTTGPSPAVATAPPPPPILITPSNGVPTSSVPRPERRFLLNPMMLPALRPSTQALQQSCNSFVMQAGTTTGVATNGSRVIYIPVTRPFTNIQNANGIPIPMTTNTNGGIVQQNNAAPPPPMPMPVVASPNKPPQVPPKQEPTFPESIAAQTLMSLQNIQQCNKRISVDENSMMSNGTEEGSSPYPGESEELEEEEEDYDDDCPLVISDVRSNVSFDSDAATPSAASAEGGVQPGQPKKRKRLRYISIPCEVCGKVVTSHNMPGHMRVHTGEKPWTCNHCGKDFRYNSSYYRHLREVHEVYDGEHQRDKFLHKCNTCGKILRCKQKLALHMTEVHGFPVEAILEENPDGMVHIPNGDEGGGGEMQGMENGQMMGMAGENGMEMAGDNGMGMAEENGMEEEVMLHIAETNEPSANN